MRYLVLTDIHSNIEALGACMTRARDAGYDRVLCCGDIVGYGPNPNETVDMVRDLNPLCIRGNHDRVASGLGEPDEFTSVARNAILWTRTQLGEAQRGYLAALPMGPLAVGEEGQLVHGALTHEDHYISEDSEAFENLLLAERRITFFGHTHFPVVYTLTRIGSPASSHVHRAEGRNVVSLETFPAAFINAGSVGQPRDGDSRAAFAIWDDEASNVEFYRVEYPIAMTQARMRAEGLPAPLVNRLAVGR
jgi:predicted phosphodiesterase